MRPLIAAEDVRRAAASGARTLEHAPDALVTPLARDEARERGVALVAAAPQPASAEPGPAAGRDGPPPVKHVETRGLRLDPFPLPGPPPEMDVRLRDVVTAADGAPVAAGVMTLREGSFAWEFTYDEVQVVLEGELHLVTPEGTVVGLPGDVLYIPEGTRARFATPSWARFVYVTYPAEWGG